MKWKCCSVVLAGLGWAGAALGAPVEANSSPARLPRTEFLLDGTAEVLASGATLLHASGDSRYAFFPGFELRSTLWAWLVWHPNAEVRQRVYASRSLIVSADYALSFPTLSARLLSGYLFPTNEVTEDHPGLAVVPRVGVNLTVPVGNAAAAGARQPALRGSRNSGWITSSLGLALRLPLSGEMPGSLDTYAPIELAYAPYTTGYRANLVVTYRSRLSERARLDLSGLADRTGARSEGRLSPIFLGVRVAAQMSLSSSVAFSAGATLYNYDQGATQVKVGADGVATRGRVRQTDLYPNLDLMWLL